MIDNEQHRFGSAGWETIDNLWRAGLINSANGTPSGYIKGQRLMLGGDAPTITIAGAGSGKLTSGIAESACTKGHTSRLIFDPRGEIAAISWHTLVMYGAYGYFWNPCRLSGVPAHHRINALDILKLGSPRLRSDTKFICEGLVPTSGSATGEYFEIRARQWLEDIFVGLVRCDGWVTFPSLYRMVQSLIAWDQHWFEFVRFMLSHKDLRTTANEIIAKKEASQNGGNEFGGIVGTIIGALGFLNDPMLEESLENADVSLEDLSTHERPVTIYLNVPAEYLKIWAPLLRVMFIVAMLYKARHPEAAPVDLSVDEAGQFGKFPALKQAFTFGRGAGLRTDAWFQSTGQIFDNHGQAGLRDFQASAGTQRYFGVRDPETARMISDSCGPETLEYDDIVAQREAIRRRNAAWRRTMTDDDPTQAWDEFHHYDHLSREKSKQSRPLITAAEVLAMPQSDQIIFHRAHDLRPIYCQKIPYFDLPHMAGRFLPNPYHPPSDRVRIQTHSGKRDARVIIERIPPSLAHFPQYQEGYAHYVEGYRPY